MSKLETVQDIIETQFVHQIITDVAYHEKNYILFTLENGVVIGLNARISFSDYEMCLELHVNQGTNTFCDPTLDIGNGISEITAEKIPLTSVEQVRSCVGEKLVGYQISSKDGVSITLKFSNGVFLEHKAVYGSDRTAYCGQEA